MSLHVIQISNTYIHKTVKVVVDEEIIILYIYKVHFEFFVILMYIFEHFQSGVERFSIRNKTTLNT